jgi:hypothetical protein
MRRADHNQSDPLAPAAVRRRRCSFSRIPDRGDAGAGSYGVIADAGRFGQRRDGA